jgi:chaperonin cofactor prefoldin
MLLSMLEQDSPSRLRSIRSLQGLNIYQTKLQSIQTVLANTQSQGTKMSDVTKALQELNKYSNLTIYNFGQMAKNIGTFTAAGVRS